MNKAAENFWLNIIESVALRFTLYERSIEGSFENRGSVTSKL